MTAPIHYMTVVLDDVKAGDNVVITKICRHCGGHTSFLGNPESVIRWQEGELVQNVWPHVNAGDRETLISGIHSGCWDEVFDA